MSEPYVRPTRYSVNLLPGSIGLYAQLFEITVEQRGVNDRWAVLRQGQCLGSDGAWAHELRPSEREDDWLDAHRFDRDTALRLAKEVAPNVTVKERTAAEVLARLLATGRIARATPADPTAFVPPAAEGLPPGALDSATDGASALDAWAREPVGRNLLAHALVQLARDGWLRTEPGEEFEVVRDRETPEPEDASSAAPAALYREVADECDQAGAAYTARALNDHAGAAFALMETFLRKANDAEYAATPCDLMNPCEDGSEPCHVHERLMAHADGEHELCNPECQTTDGELRRIAAEEQPTPCDESGPCKNDEFCDTHQTERDHANGDHEYCGITCEVEFTSEKLRNGILWRAAPGSANMLKELLRRAAAGARQPEGF